MRLYVSVCVYICMYSQVNQSTVLEQQRVRMVEKKAIGKEAVGKLNFWGKIIHFLQLLLLLLLLSLSSH